MDILERQQFDIAGVVLAMGSAGLSKEIKIVDPLERRLVADVAVAGMSSVVRGRFDIENLATQLITDAAAVGMQQQRTKPMSDDYHQSKKASGGAGHITQTTLEQQWESHLINDAEFTANTHLPSITFDVNKVDVSQQLGERVGEEVSHFYHPTPSPRNPSGFWRGVDDVLEMQEETRKAADLIFTGHYETPKNRWQEAGYAIGVPLAIGAQFVMAGERLGAEAVGVVENIYQGGQRVFGNVTSKLQRWGLFGHNGIEKYSLISSIKRVSSDFANEAFLNPKAIEAGWNPPYPSGLGIRELKLSQTTNFVRVFTGDDPTGQFLVRYKEIAHIIDNPEAIKIYLGLKDTPTSIADVYVPSDTRLLAGRIGSQPNFGLNTKSGFQYQLLEQIPRANFTNIRLLQQLADEYYPRINP